MGTSKIAGTRMNQTAAFANKPQLDKHSMAPKPQKRPKGRKPEQADPQYSRLEEHLNGWTHALGAGLGIAALVLTLVQVAGNPSPAKIAAALIYGISLIALYSISSAYHFTHQGRAKRILRIFDHSTIFLLIAGCYTPFCLLALDETPMGMVILILQWSIALVGIGLNIWNMRAKAVKLFSLVSYVVMGWMVVVSIRPLIANVEPLSLILLLSGGIAYTVGIVFYILGHKKRFMHSVWHLFVLAGSVLQFFSIFMLF